MKLDNLKSNISESSNIFCGLNEMKLNWFKCSSLLLSYMTGSD